MRAHRHDVLTVMVYILEAHFVERDASGSVTNGWPIGFKEYEHPQHRSVEDRLQMFQQAKHQMTCINEADIQCVDSWSNDFNNFFGAWPDQVFAVDAVEEKLIFKGQLSAEQPGTRDDAFSSQLEVFLKARNA